MPGKSEPRHPLRELRQAIGLTQGEFARLIGVGTSTVKRIESRTLKMSQELAARMFLATGFMVTETPGGKQTMTWNGEPYTKESFELWKAELATNTAVASALTAQLVNWIEILLLASARPGAGKTVQVFHALLQSLHRITDEFQMQKHIDALLSERHSTETQLYRVGDLRKNSLLASMVQFQDDPTLTDQDEIPLTKPVGWLQHRELFAVLWTHQELLRHWIDSTQNGLDVTPDLAENLQRVEKDLEAIP